MKSTVDWSQLVTFILDELFFSQKELAEHCNVTQQSISNWKMKVRSPGPYAKRKLTEIASNGGIRLSSFKVGYDSSGQTSPDVALQELIEIYNELPLQARDSLLEFARFERRRGVR
jgi:transcriptional regulator with XRE-family HTH domain